MHKKIIITGGAGYIGAHTVVALVNEGFTPIIVDDFRNSSLEVIDGISQLIGFSPIYYAVDVCDKKALTLIFEEHNIDSLIHFAAYKAVGESVKEPLKYYHNNLVGLINILTILNEKAIRRFVFSSSCTVYGEPEGIKAVKENTPKQLPTSPYGYTKWMAEQIIQDFADSQINCKTICLRYFNPVGAHPSGLIGELPVGAPSNLLPFITQTAVGKQKKLFVFGNDYPTEDGTCVRDYIHVVDLAQAHVKALKALENNESATCEFINVGTGKGTSVLQMITSFEEISGTKLPWEFAKRRAGDVAEIYANVDFAKNRLNWAATYTFRDAIIDAWRWEQGNLSNKK